MPTFCRHGRLEENCSICSKKSRVSPGTVAGRAEARRAATPKAPRPASSSRRPSSPRPSSDLRVRRVARAVEDGYHNDLVPGLRSSADARRLAEEIALSVARLEVLATDPPGVYADALLAGDPEAGLRLLFDAAARSERRGADPRRLEEASAKYFARAEGVGGQHVLLSGEPSLSPQRRFDRAFERLTLPGFGRSPRYDFLVTAGRLGLLEVEPWSLQLGAAEALDPTLVAAKRVFGIGDALNLGRRAAELSAEGAFPIAALDLALFNWSQPDPSDRDPGGADVAASAEALASVSGALDLKESADAPQM